MITTKTMEFKMDFMEAPNGKDVATLGCCYPRTFQGLYVNSNPWQQNQPRIDGYPNRYNLNISKRIIKTNKKITTSHPHHPNSTLFYTPTL